MGSNKVLLRLVVTMDTKQWVQCLLMIPGHYMAFMDDDEMQLGAGEQRTLSRRTIWRF